MQFNVFLRRGALLSLWSNNGLTYAIDQYLVVILITALIWKKKIIALEWGKW